MAYFNSLRELGHAATLIRADIREHLNAVWDRLKFANPPRIRTIRICGDSSIGIWN